MTRMQWTATPSNEPFTKKCRLTVVLSLLALGGCARVRELGDFRVWAIPSEAPLVRSASPEPQSDLFNQEARTIRLDAAVNETVAFQLVMRSESSSSRVTGVGLAPFIGD